MALLEAAIIKKIVRKLKSLYGSDFYFFKTHGSADQARGLPDLIGCYKGECPNCGFGPLGLFLGLEVKRPGKDATELQAFTLKRIQAAGGYATVVHSFEEVEDFLSNVPAPPAEATEERDN